MSYLKKEIMKHLESKMVVGHQKYIYNYASYYNVPWYELSNSSMTTPLGFRKNANYSPYSYTLGTPALNVVKSIIDTLTSKIAQSKVRPFFNSVNGTWRTTQVCRNAQQFFDYYFDEQGVHEMVAETFRASLIFDLGALYVDKFSNSVRRLNPWEFAVLDAEWAARKITKALVRVNGFPNTLLETFYGIDIEHTRDVELKLYYDTLDHTCEIYVDQKLMKTTPYEAEKVPLVIINANPTVVGARTISLVDELEDTQQLINLISTKIKDAAQLTPENIIVVPKTDDLRAETLSNGCGKLLQYQPAENGQTPLQVVTPAFINSEYISLLELLIQKAYEIAGISQLSAQSQKPSGLNSGVALQSMENIESDRFETQLNKVVKSYVDLAKLCIDVFDADAEVLPKDFGRKDIKWREIKQQGKNMSIQYSAATSFSKDPSEKMKQIMQLSQAGLIPQQMVSQLLEIPDLESVYTITSAAYNTARKIIENAIDNEDYELPNFFNKDILDKEISTTQNILFASGDTKRLERINKLDATFYDWLLENGFEQLDQTHGPQPNQEMMVSDAGIASQGAVTPEGWMDEGLAGGVVQPGDMGLPGNPNPGIPGQDAGSQLPTPNGPLGAQEQMAPLNGVQ